LPFFRTRLGDRITALGDAEAREAMSTAAEINRMRGHSSFADDEELFSNLPAELSCEAMMLAKHGGLVAQLLSQLAPDKRDLAYLHLCNAHRNFGDAMTGLTLERLTDQMEGRVGGNYLRMKPAELHDYQPPVYQMQPVQPDRTFGELPADAPLPTMAPAPMQQINPAQPPTPTAAPVSTDETSPYDDIDMEEAQQQSDPTYALGGQLFPLFQSPGVPHPDLMSLPLADRGKLVLEAIDAAGGNLGMFLNRPTFFSGGRSRAGKTSILTMMAILEAAIYGRKVVYITADQEIYPFAFSEIATGSPANAKAGFLQFAEIVSNAGQGELDGYSFVLDEFARTVGKLSAEQKEELWTVPLVALAKTKGKMRGVLHGKTSAMCGVPNGWNQTFLDEVVIAQGERTQSHDGTYHPAGKYDLLESGGKDTLDSSGVCIFIPEWLKFARNETLENSPCFVRSLLAFFPELDTRKTGHKPGQFVKADSVPVKPVIVPMTPAQGDEFEAEDIEVVPVMPAPLPKVKPVPSAPSNPKEPVIEGTRYTVSEVMEKVAGYLKKQPGKSFTSAQVIRKFNSADREGLGKIMPSILDALARHYPANYETTKLGGGAISIKRKSMNREQVEA